MIKKINVFGIRWFKNWLFEVKHLIRAIYFRYPLKLIKYQTIRLLSYGLVYPLARIILRREKAHKISQSYLDTFLSGFTVPLPPPLKSKITTIDGSNYTNYFAIFIRNIYLQEFLRKEMHVIDVGANIGFYTVLASEKIGKKGKIVAIEPESRNYSQLIKNIEMNNLQNVIPAKIALSDHCGFEKLYLHPSSVSHYVKIILLCDHYPLEKNEVCQFLNERGFKTKIYYEKIVTTI